MTPESEDVEQTYGIVVKFGVPAALVLVLILLLLAASRAVALRAAEQDQTATAVAVLNWTLTAAPTHTPDHQATADWATLRAVLGGLASQTAAAQEAPPTETPNYQATGQAATLRALVSQFSGTQTAEALAAMPTRTPQPSRTPTIATPTRTPRPTRTPTPTPTGTPTERPATVTETPAVSEPVITMPTDGDIVEAGLVLVQGTAAPDASVLIRDGSGETIGGVVTPDTGRWQITVNLAQAGRVTLKAVVVDDGDNALAESETITVTVAEPRGVTAPVITAPADGSTVEAGQMAVAGTAAPGAIVHVLDERGQVLAGAMADGVGAWRVGVYLLQAGRHDLTAAVVDSNNNVLAASAPLTVNVQRGAVVEQGGPAPVITSPSDRDQFAPGEAKISGTADPGAIILIEGEEGLVLGSAEADEEGAWQATLTLTRIGQVTFVAHAVITADVETVEPDNVLATSAELTVVIVATPATPPPR